MRKLLAYLLYGVLALLVVIIGFVFIRTRPSGDIDKYAEFLIDQKTTASDSSVKVTFFGVSTLLIDDGDTQLLIDGFFSRPSMFTVLTSDIETDKAIVDAMLDFYRMKRVSAVFVTHSHYDHAFDAGYVAKATGANLYGSKSTLNIGRGAGLDESQLRLFEPNVDIHIGNFIVRVIPSRHSPGNELEDEELDINEPLSQPTSFKKYLQGGAYDFLIIHHGRKIYIKPSPNFIPGALDSLNADALFLGIATITKQTPEWVDEFYKENVLSLHPKVVVPIHWDNFFQPMSGELVMLPRFTSDCEKDFDYFVRRTKDDNINFSILQGGSSIVIE